MNNESTKHTAFVLMPFGSEFDPVYSMFLKPTLEEVGFSVNRADDVSNNQSIIRDIVESIAESDLIVADLTTNNPNVFYELGVAHGLRKPVILLTQDIGEVPFDLKSYRLVKYGTHFAEMSDARENLSHLLKNFLTGVSKFGNPVTDFYSGDETSVQREASTLIGSAEHGDDDRGFLDHISDVEEGYEELTDLVNELSQRLTSDTEIINSSATKLASADTKARLKLMKSLAKTLDNLGRDIESKNKQYEEISIRTNDSLEFIFDISKIQSQEDFDALDETLESLEKTQHSVEAGREGFLQMKAAIDALPPIERTFDRAVKTLSYEVGRFADNTEQTASSMRRAIDLGRKKLDSSGLIDSD